MASKRSKDPLTQDPDSVSGMGPLSQPPHDSARWKQALGRSQPISSWVAWRWRVLVVFSLLGCVALLLLARSLAGNVHVHATWRTVAGGELELVSSPDPQLRALNGMRLRGMLQPDGSVSALNALVLHHSARWLVDDGERNRQARMNQHYQQALQRGDLRFVFKDGTVARPGIAPRGLQGLGLPYWSLSALALALYVTAVAVILVRPRRRNLAFGVTALAQSGSMVIIATESIPGLGLASTWMQHALPMRVGLDLCTAAALLHTTSLHLRRLPWARVTAGAGWLLSAGLMGLVLQGSLPGVWWWTQGAVIALGAAAIVQLGRIHRLEPNPLANVLHRFCVAAMATLALLTVVVALVERSAAGPYQLAAVGSVIWYVFLASLLLLLPFLSRSQQVLREFALLAGISTIASSLDLLFLAVFSLGQFASLTLALFLALGIYAGSRRWMLNQLVGPQLLTTERVFERLYRIAREVESRPDKAGDLLAQLLQDLFEPLELRRIQLAMARPRVVGDGSALLVPVPQVGMAPMDMSGPGAASGSASGSVIVLRYSHRGKRLFTHDDARLIERVVEQLTRAVAFDKAVEQGRNEERVRLAQDLHDDIGARLLTLMYKAPNQEMEDYARHTLQDLKTLTRGLAAADHRLSYAAAEWKADLSQRLGAAQCELVWSFVTDRDMMLSVVQWSALTRILRELVTNAIAHAHASTVEVSAVLEAGAFTLSVTDNGRGKDPKSWSHGLGLGGVRKRVKQLGGEVQWHEHTPSGICCRVHIPHLADRP
jgi:signal transduction histidine kinase